MATPLPKFLVELTAAINVVDPLVMRTTAKAADQIKAEAQRRAPKKTGALRKSIKSHGAQKSINGISAKVTAGGPSSPHDVDYAQYVELGFVHRSGTPVGPRPFMRPALNKIRPQYEKELADVLELLAAGRPGRAVGKIRR